MKIDENSKKIFNKKYKKVCEKIEELKRTDDLDNLIEAQYLDNYLNILILLNEAKLNENEKRKEEIIEYIYTFTDFPKLLEKHGLPKEPQLINLEELKKFIKRRLDKGKYSDTPQGQKAEENILKLILKITGVYNLKNYHLQKLNTNKNLLNIDYSLLGKYIRDTLIKSDGDVEKPYLYGNFKITRAGKQLNNSQLVLLDYILGLCIEHGEREAYILMQSDLTEALGKTNYKGDRIELVIRDIMQIATNVIKIDVVKSKNKTAKNILELKSKFSNYKAPQHLLKLTRNVINGENALQIEIPLIKLFSSLNCWDRKINKEILKYWRTKPRICLIAKELVAIYRNKNNDTLTLMKMLENINELDRYNKFGNKRVYLNRLKEDVEEAIKYIEIDEPIKLKWASASKTPEIRILIGEGKN